MPKVPEIAYEDITIADSHSLGYDTALCVEGLYAIHDLIKMIQNADNAFLEPQKVLNALYCIGVFGRFGGDDLTVLDVDGQSKDKKAHAFFPAAKYLFALEEAGFLIFDMELAGMAKPKNKLAMKDILSFKVSFPRNKTLLLGLKVFAAACSKIVGDPFYVGDIRVVYKGASKMYAPPIDEVFYRLTEEQKDIMTAIHEKLERLGCERNLEREYIMRYIHPKAKGKTFATIYTVNQAWLSVSGEKTDVNLKLNLRHIGHYVDYLYKCSESIQRCVERAENCGGCEKACGGVSFEFRGVKYCKCPWHIFRFNDFSKQAMDNYIKLIDLEDKELCLK